MMTDLIAGQVDVASVPVALVTPQVRDGKLKVLVVDASSRVPALPEAPVFSETGVAPVQAEFIFAMSAPAGTLRL